VTETRILGRGRGAVRVRLTSDSVQLTTPGLIIDGNADMRMALAWVLDNAPSSSSGWLADTGIDVAEICSLLRELSRQGIAMDSWGQAWVMACA
jgi:hypothetical protein